MSFNTLPFFLFLAAVLVSLRILPSHRARLWFLVSASLFFYAWWDLRLVPLLLGLALSNFGLGVILGQQDRSQRSKGRWLRFGIGLNLGILVVFKYSNFFIDTLRPLLHSLGLNPGTVEILLPLGISFFVFEFISFLVDQTNDRIHHRLDLAEFLAFAFFFPRLASGPIIRPADFLPQLEQALVPRWPALAEGFQIFLLGLVKKVVVADNLAGASDTIFANPAVFDTISVWGGVLAYSIQIYCDFSGYSDMAIGTAHMLGVRLPVNFRLPYVATSVTEFWHRWHLSLSTWLRDYLYFPLGGSRHGEARREVNLFLTMFLGGLWHGASWSFALWGILHGGALAVQKHWTKSCGRAPFHLPGWLRTAFGWTLTMVFILATWTIFRSPTLEGAVQLLIRMFFPTAGLHWIYLPLFWGLLPLLVVATVIRWRSPAPGYVLLNLSKPGPQFLVAFVLLGILVLHATKAAPFIYFQF